MSRPITTQGAQVIEHALHFLATEGKTYRNHNKGEGKRGGGNKKQTRKNDKIKKIKKARENTTGGTEEGGKGAELRRGEGTSKERGQREGVFREKWSDPRNKTYTLTFGGLQRGKPWRKGARHGKCEKKGDLFIDIANS